MRVMWLDCFHPLSNGRGCGDVITDVCQVVIVADDVLVIVALPDSLAGGETDGVDFAGRDRFEILDNGG